MDLKDVTITIIKIIISTIVIQNIQGATLMGGHIDNKNHTTNDKDILYNEYDYSESEEISTEKPNKTYTKADTNSEEIPDPSPLVLPGYNLPENIFNHGKPFYVEKDPMTGKIDFNHKSPSLKSSDDDLYDYISDDPTDDMYDKRNIDRKDGGIGLASHKPNDVNQLTPNFHDFLNLPVKYNPDKYVYPLISSSYASTKIQGSVNKFHNHKDTYNVKTTTKKPTMSPTYYTTNSYYNPRTTQRTASTTSVTTTTTPRPTTVKRYPELTTKSMNLLDAEMSHPSFTEDYEYYDNPTEAIITTTKKAKPSEVYLTTPSVNDKYLTTKTSTLTTTTKRTLSLFEQLFGDYDESATTTENTKHPALFSNLPTNKSNTSMSNEIPKTEKPLTTSTMPNYPNIHAGPHTNVLSGTSMGLDAHYEYDDDYTNDKIQDSIAVENKVYSKIDDSLSVEPLKPDTNKTTVYKTSLEDKKNNEKKPTNVEPSKIKPISIKPTYLESYNDKPTVTQPATTIKTTTAVLTTTSTQPTTSRVTSLPLGENHINTPSLNRDPIIVATQNLREKLNSERVKTGQPQLVIQFPPQPQDQNIPSQLVPSTSNIHIAPDQDTVSFVVGHHQSVGDGGYVGTSLKESPFDDKPFRPLYGQEATYSSNSDNNGPQLTLKPPQVPEVAGSAVTIQPLQNSEASLAIGMPVNGIKQVPGQVMDASLDNDGHIEFPKVPGNKIVFPEDEKPVRSNVIPQRLEPATIPNREVLKLNSKPMYHQLPSDLTPPKENDFVALPPRHDRPVRPPWDPRPGHFHSGKPEYVRPPRPPPEVAYKRIDNLPNILPQFRPNTKHHYPPPHYYDNRLNRQPLLERPSNRPIGFFEKLMPPPPPPQYHLYKNKHILKSPSPQQNYEERRPLNQQSLQSLEEGQSPIAEDRIINEDPRKPHGAPSNNAPLELNLYQTPPNIHIANRRHGDSDAEVETLQMIQAKNEKEKTTEQRDPEPIRPDTIRVTPERTDKGDSTDKTIYKVYPVNTGPLKMDAIDSDQREGVVVGTRAELPLPPSKIESDFNYELQDRHEAPILKPHPRPPTFPTKSDFPYPLERPDSPAVHPSVPEAAHNKLDEIHHDPYVFNNQWNMVGENSELRIVTGSKNKYSNQISVTLKTYTEKPIAIAYTPTEPNLHADKYSMPNYGSPVIPEIRPGTVENAETGYGSKNKNEFTVSATMHTNPLPPIRLQKPTFPEPSNYKFNHKSDTDLDAAPVHDSVDFQAPFQASVKIDSSMNQGWSVVRDKNKTTPSYETEATTMPFATTSEFDIENFKPQLIGGFKPLYNLPDMETKKAEDVLTREE